VWVVKSAVYGALPNGDANNAKAADVTQSLQNHINNLNGVVRCDNDSFGDPAPGFDKHFGAVVTRTGNDGSVDDFFFACDEGQTIDFNTQGGRAQQKSALSVKFAVYGALPGGSPVDAQAFDVGARLQDLLNLHQDGRVAIDNDSFGDPSVGNTKHFAAIVSRGGSDLHFACQEGQTIDFTQGGN
jgi:hypothetical protein